MAINVQFEVFDAPMRRPDFVAEQPGEGALARPDPAAELGQAGGGGARIHSRSARFSGAGDSIAVPEIANT